MKRATLRTVVVVFLSFCLGCPYYRNADKQSFELSECRELEGAIHKATAHYQIEPQAMIEFVVAQEPERASASKPDRNEAMVWLLGARSMVHVYDTAQKKRFFEFDVRQLKDLDGDGWLEYYSKSHRTFVVDEKGGVTLGPEK